MSYLELLQKKVTPNKQQYIKFAKKEPITESVSEEKDEILTQSEISKPLIILDKRRSSAINRDIILDRLRKQEIFKVKPKSSDVKSNIYIPKGIPEPKIIEVTTKNDTPIILSEAEFKIKEPIEEVKDDSEEE